MEPDTTRSPHRRRWLGVLVLLAIAGAWLSGPGCRTIAAARLVQDAQRPAHELADRVDESEERHGEVTVLVARPRGESGPLPGLVLVHGAVDTGARDVRMIALARALALRGFHVAAPDLPSLKAFRADPQDVELLVRLLTRLGDDRERVRGQRLALVGISIGGSYGLLAAARPEVRERVRAVFAFGAYDDLESLLRSWMVAPRRDVPELYDPLVEGRRRVLLGNLDALVPPADTEPLRRALLALLSGGQAPSPEGLSPQGARLLACALSTEPIEAAVADAALAPVVGDLQALSPARGGAAPDARVFLLHGESDPIVPPSDAPALRDSLARNGARVRVLVTDAFTHVAAGERPSLWSSWKLVRFVAGFLGAAGP